MLAVLGGLADVERDLIKTRTSEGRMRAIQQGKRMGAPSQNYRKRRLQNCALSRYIQFNFSTSN
jgi:DNA invertase Pin-like site-specific DNA recombinase